MNLSIFLLALLQWDYRHSLAFSGSSFSTVKITSSGYSSLYMSAQRDNEYSTNDGAKNESLLGKMAGKILTAGRPTISLQMQVPQPPRYSPHVDEQLQRDLMESQRLIRLMEMEIELVRELLDLKEEELLEEQNRFRDERRDLLVKLDASVAAMSRREDSAAKLREEQISEQETREKQFLNEIKQLSTQLEEKIIECSTERENAKILKTNLEAVQNTLKNAKVQFDQEKQEIASSFEKEKARAAEMNEKLNVSKEDFEKLQSELMAQVNRGKEKLKLAQASLLEKDEIMQASIEAERDKVVKLEQKLVDSKKTFGTVQSELQENVKIITENLERVQTSLQEKDDQMELIREKQVEKLADMENEFRVKEEEFTKTRSELLDQVTVLLKEEKENVQNSQDLMAERDKLQEEVKLLQQKIVQEQKSTELTMGTMEEERRQFEVEKKEMQLKIDEENETILKLESEMMKAQETFEQEREELETKRLQAEERALASSERTSREKTALEENKRLESDLAKEKERHEKAKRMLLEQSQDIREEMTVLLEKARSEAEKEKSRLRDIYENQLSHDATKAASMEEDLRKLKVQNEELMHTLAELKIDEKESAKKTKLLEANYAALLSKNEKVKERAALLDAKVNEIKSLKGDLETIINEAARTKEESIAKTNELEEKYEVLVNENARLTQILRNRQHGASQNFHWAVDNH